MADESKIQIVDFATWCPKCKFKNLDESKDPCNECLSNGGNVDSRIPVNYKGERPTTKSDWVKEANTPKG